MTAIADAADGLAMALPRAAALIAHPGTTPSGPGGRPGSRPPWNQPAANATWDAIAAIRDWEAMFRYLITGASGKPRPASSTGAGLKAITSLAYAVPRDVVRAAERDLAHRMQAIMVLDDVDEAERPQRVTGIECRYCEMPMLMTLPKAGIVYCKRGGFACWDTDGNPPRGLAMVGRLGPCIEWSDGLVT